MSVSFYAFYNAMAVYASMHTLVSKPQAVIDQFYAVYEKLKEISISINISIVPAICIA